MLKILHVSAYRESFLIRNRAHYNGLYAEMMRTAFGFERINGEIYWRTSAALALCCF